jgi:hypothetical protein
MLLSVLCHDLIQINGRSAEGDILADLPAAARWLVASNF